MPCLTLLVFIIFPKNISHKLKPRFRFWLKSIVSRNRNLFFMNLCTALNQSCRNISDRITVSNNFVFLMKYSHNLKFCLYTLIGVHFQSSLAFDLRLYWDLPLQKVFVAIFHYANSYPSVLLGISMTDLCRKSSGRSSQIWIP